MAKRKASAHISADPKAESVASSWQLSPWIALPAIVLMLGTAGWLLYDTFVRRQAAAPAPAITTNQSATTDAITATNTTTAAAPATNTATTAPPNAAEPYQMSVAQAVMVTVELDFGGRVPSIAEALQQIERVHQPDDGQGRTFAILDAYGEPTPDGKLHMSMHVSSEKPGLGLLRFKRTGATLWQGRIGKPGDASVGAKNLNIYLDNGAGGNFVLDGQRSTNANSVLDVLLQNSQQRVRDVWPDGSERELTFVYSACGCPVKAKVRRTGERTQRTSELPVMFPDDPAALTMIAGLMKW